MLVWKSDFSSSRGMIYHDIGGPFGPGWQSHPAVPEILAATCCPQLPSVRDTQYSIANMEAVPRNAHISQILAFCNCWTRLHICCLQISKLSVFFAEITLLRNHPKVRWGVFGVFAAVKVWKCSLYLGGELIWNDHLFSEKDDPVL